MYGNDRKTIGLFACNLPESFQRRFCQSFAQKAEKKNYNLAVFSNFGGYDNNLEYITGESHILDIPYYEELDAIVLLLNVYDIPKELVEKLMNHLQTRAGCPIISIRERHSRFTNLLCDDREAICRMVNHVIDCHQAERIYYLSGPVNLYDIARREEGYVETMQRRGKVFDPRYIYHGNLWYNTGREAVEYFLSLSDEMPDAIICANDYMAVAVCEELDRRNIDVPGSILVTGFDDVDETTEMYPQITTVHVDENAFAEKTLEIIQDALDGRPLEKNYYISTYSVYRASCGCSRPARESTLFRQLFEQKRQLLHLSRQNTFMVFRMERINQYEGLPDLVGRFLESTGGVTNFYLCLNEREQYENMEREGRPFTERMILAFHAFFNENHVTQVEQPQIPFMRRELLPRAYQGDESQIFFVNPLHFGEHCFGYALISFENHEYQERGTFYQSFIVNICSVLENICIQNEIEKLNREKIHLLRYERNLDIYNQYGFFEAVSDYMKESMEEKIPLTLIYIRIENFQEILSSYGWSEGDTVFGTTARVIKKCLDQKTKYIVGRIGEYEIGIVWQNKKWDALLQIGQRILEESGRVNRSWDKDYFLDIDYSGYIQNTNEWIGFDEFIRRARMNLSTSRKKSSTQYVNMAIQYIRHNYFHEISVQGIADHIGITRAYLSSCFSAAYSMSVQEYITEYRMNKAKDLLCGSRMKIREIAFSVGYRDELYFSKAFKKTFGVSPKRFREEMNP